MLPSGAKHSRAPRERGASGAAGKQGFFDHHRSGMSVEIVRMRPVSRLHHSTAAVLAPAASCRTLPSRPGVRHSRFTNRSSCGRFRGSSRLDIFAQYGESCAAPSRSISSRSARRSAAETTAHRPSALRIAVAYTAVNRPYAAPGENPAAMPRRPCCGRNASRAASIRHARGEPGDRQA